MSRWIFYPEPTQDVLDEVLVSCSEFWLNRDLDLYGARFCSGCGRKMVLAETWSSRFDTRTGKKNKEWFWVCPRWPRNGFVYLFLRVHHHDCVSATNPMTVIEYL